jgi:hypothetical protein
MGKVHGSLARAGKVKSATPKVGYPLSFVFFEGGVAGVICGQGGRISAAAGL